jgi:2-hydroxychromene-2-carboxylate isomerase
MSRRPRLYFSFRSPFSWLLVVRLRRAVPDAFERLQLVPYWEPDERTAGALAERGAAIHYAAMSKAKHLYILQDVKRLATGLGLDMRWPVDVEPWWEPSHLGWLAARHAGRAAEFYDEIIAARWERGEDISTLAVVREAARRAGLDGDAIASACDDPACREEGVRSLYRAYEEDVFGVPYLIAGWQRFWGADRLDAFLAATGLAGPAPAAVLADREPALSGAPARLLATPGMYDNDTAGGCG